MTWLVEGVGLPPWAVLVVLAVGGIFGWLARRPRGMPAARGDALDRIAMDRFAVRREGWREKLPVFGDRAFRRRLQAYHVFAVYPATARAAGLAVKSEHARRGRR